MSIAIELDGAGPLYTQVYRALRAAIAEGAFAQGDRLPASRELARDLGVSRTVVLSAYDCLAAEGIIQPHVGRGTIVATASGDLSRVSARGAAPRELRPAARTPFADVSQAIAAVAAAISVPTAPARFDFSYGATWIDASFASAWRRALASAAAATNYPDPRGDPELRQEVLAHASRARGLQCTADNIIITAGAQQAYDLIARCLVEPGGGVALEEPGYFSARWAFSACGAKLCLTQTDDAGLIVEDLRTTKSATPIRLAFVTPSHQMPTGAVMSIARRRELIDWAAREGAYIIEDDYDGEYRFGGPLIPSLQSMDDSERVIYVGTFSKTMFPGLRLGYIAAPPHLASMFSAAKLMLDWGANHACQRALAEFFASGAYARRIRTTSRRYARQRHKLMENLRTAFGDDIEIFDRRAGMHLYVKLVGRKDPFEPAILQALRRRGVVLHDIRPYFAGERRAGEMILGFSRLDGAGAEAGVAALADTL